MKASLKGVVLDTERLFVPFTIGEVERRIVSIIISLDSVSAASFHPETDRCPVRVRRVSLVGRRSSSANIHLQPHLHLRQLIIRESVL